MNSTTTLKSLPVSLRRRLARKAERNHRSVEGEIVHRLERSVEADEAEEQLAAHLRRALSAEQTPMKPDDVLAWADETFDRLERAARKK
jgi:Arc-like DNA binding domain